MADSKDRSVNKRVAAGCTTVSFLIVVTIGIALWAIGNTFDAETSMALIRGRAESLSSIQRNITDIGRDMAAMSLEPEREQKEIQAYRDMFSKAWSIV